MRNTRWASGHRSSVTIIAALLVWASAATTAIAAAEKSFTATVNPEPLVAGASYGEGARATSYITLLITNTSNQANLGSANVTAPTGITLTGASPSGIATVVGASLLELRSLDLAPGGVATVSISARVECAANNGPYTWGFNVKQANDFNGTPGNDLVQDASVTNTIWGTCGLEFSKQPKHSEKAPVVITNNIYDPAGEAVTVTVKDAASVDTVAWWSGDITLAIGEDPGADDAVLGGTISGSTTVGPVEFAPTINLSASGYTLTATASPTAGTPSAGTSTGPIYSNAFNIVDDAAICAVAATCFAEAGVNQKTKARVDAKAVNGAAGDLVILAINPTNDPIANFSCAGYTTVSDTIVFNVTAADGTSSSQRAKTATLTLAASAVTKSASKYQVCYNDGTVVKLLPTCTVKTPSPPCVVSKTLDRVKNLVIVVSAPPGDPGLKF